MTIGTRADACSTCWNVASVTSMMYSLAADPFPLAASQLAQPLLQLIPHVPLVHVAEAFVAAEHM